MNHDWHASLGAGAVAVLLYAVAGGAAASRLGPFLGVHGRAGQAGLAFGLGSAAVGLLQVALGVLGRPAGWVVPVVTAAVSLLALLLARAAARLETQHVHLGHHHGGALDPLRADADDAVEAAGTPGPAGDGPGPAAGSLAGRRVLLALLVVAAVGSSAVATGFPFRADGSRFWAPRAREFALAGADTMPSLFDARRLGVHRDYPLLVPALMAPVFAASPPDAQAGPKLVLAAAVVALLLVVHDLLSRRSEAARGWLAAFLALPLLVAPDVRESIGSGGYADGFDALFVLLLVLGVVRLRLAGACPAGFAAAALAGAALLSTKLEGAVELGVVLVAAATAPLAARGLALAPGVRAGRALLLLAVAAAALLAALPTLILRAHVAPDPPGFDLARLLDPAQLLARGPAVLAGLGGLLLDASAFGLLLPLVLVALFTAPPTPARALAARVVAGLAAFLFVTYLATNMHALRHVHTSAHRVVLHWLPALVVLLAPAAAPAAAVSPPDDAEAGSRAGSTGGPAG